MVSKTRKNVPWRGWKSEKPGAHQKTVMLRKCGKKCFLGPKKSFPICKKNTCKISKKGVYAAYVRARQYKKGSVSKKAKRLLRKL
jgi:hypothetical protein